MFPVESILPALRASLEKNRSVVLRAPPGSGKTTCVPLDLLNAPFLKGKKIILLEPRRLAARGCAVYMARKLGEEVGGTVGYQVRLERCISPRTRLEVVTEGLLTQRLLNDPELADVGLVIFDEFHERSLPCDVGFAMALEVRRALRPDMRLLVMSATFDTEPIAAHLGDADIHTAEARMFPVETQYLNVRSIAPIAAQMAGAVRRMLPVSTGGVLCFLPGEGEIRRCAEELRDVPRVYPLYGALSREEQDRAVAASIEKRVVLATAIAETSLTLEGITTVIDSGLMRVSRFSPSSGMSRLDTLRVTRDRAEQRRGRAGRTAPGLCLRLWTKAEDPLLLPSRAPEILEADLASVVLTCAQWGTTAREGMPWLTPPPEGTWGSACELLRLLGALDASGHITAKGRRMAQFPTHPRLANMILETGNTLLAAIIEEGAPHGVCDIRDVRPTSRMRELARRWGASREGEAGEALAFAFPDRIAHNRGNGTFQMSCGRGACLDRAESLSASEFLVLADLDDRGGDARIHLAAPITREALEEIFAGEITERTVTEWDRRTESVRAVKERCLWKMVLERGGQSAPDESAVQAALFAGIRQKGVDQLPWTTGTRQLQARINFLHAALPEADWPVVTDAGLTAHLEDWFAGFTLGMSRWSHLAKLDLAAVLDYALSETGHDRRELDRLAPTHMDVPSGSSMTIHYEEAEPFVQVRLQECFGLYETPKVAGGKVPIVMKLLSPAQRPVQVTKDLAGFWRETYQLVRKDLRGRYPKHYWPEDPFTAVATRRVRPH